MQRSPKKPVYPRENTAIQDDDANYRAINESIITRYRKQRAEIISVHLPKEDEQHALSRLDDEMEKSMLRIKREYYGKKNGSQKSKHSVAPPQEKKIIHAQTPTTHCDALSTEDAMKLQKIRAQLQSAKTVVVTCHEQNCF